MRYGVTIFATDQTWRIDEVAVAAEARGFTSLYIPEHTHIPVSRTTPPPTGEAELAEGYKRTLDPFIALAAAGARTSTIRLGTGISLIGQREPIVTAKAIATLDYLTGGRVDLGIGFGWNIDEMENHGIDPTRRRELVRETVLAMRSLWTDDVASFDGDFVQVAPSWSWPKPVQAGGPPVLLGSAPAPKALAAVAEYCDGWMPIGGAGIREALPVLRERCEEIGRDPSTVTIVPFGTLYEPGKLEYYESIGVDEVVLRIPAGGPDTVLPELDRLAAATGVGG
ncbi:MAG: LLM class F420-dependent oxidoreductase [Actinobacteria bacterium]|nr:LLM class F420-dependent oxidoreductase [Actinomycetota bacterium]